MAVEWSTPYTVARTEIDGILISTVSLVCPSVGTGHTFETLVWKEGVDPEVDGARYHDEDDARQGHYGYVMLARAGAYDHGWWDDCECKTCHDAGEVKHPMWGASNCPEPSIPCPRCAK